MATLKSTFNAINGWLKSITDLGVSAILACVVIDILFPGTLGVVENLGEIVGTLAKEGAVGLVALLIFLLIYKK